MIQLFLCFLAVTAVSSYPSIFSSGYSNNLFGGASQPIGPGYYSPLAYVAPQWRYGSQPMLPVVNPAYGVVTKPKKKDVSATDLIIHWFLVNSLLDAFKKDDEGEVEMVDGEESGINGEEVVVSTDNISDNFDDELEEELGVDSGISDSSEVGVDSGVSEEDMFGNFDDDDDVEDMGVDSGISNLPDSGINGDDSGELGEGVVMTAEDTADDLADSTETVDAAESTSDEESGLDPAGPGFDADTGDLTDDDGIDTFSNSVEDLDAGLGTESIDSGLGPEASPSGDDDASDDDLEPFTGGGDDDSSDADADTFFPANIDQGGVTDGVGEGDLGDQSSEEDVDPLGVDSFSITDDDESGSEDKNEEDASPWVSNPAIGLQSSESDEEGRTVSVSGYPRTGAVGGGSGSDEDDDGRDSPPASLSRFNLLPQSPRVPIWYGNSPRCTHQYYSKLLCRSTGGWKGTSGISQWCNWNCPYGQCSRQMCYCECIEGQSYDLALLNMFNFGGGNGGGNGGGDDFDDDGFSNYGFFQMFGDDK